MYFLNSLITRGSVYVSLLVELYIFLELQGKADNSHLQPISTRKSLEARNAPQLLIVYKRQIL